MNKTQVSLFAHGAAKQAKTGRKILVILAAFILVLSFSVSAHAIIDDVAPSSGSCGPNASFNITNVNNLQTLAISGSGPITSHPWNDENYISRLVIEAISIPEGITSICSGALDSGVEATSVTLPNSLVTIMPNAIGGSIKTVYIGTGTSDIRQGAFNSASCLRNIYVDNANSYYKSDNGTLLSKDGTVFYFLPYGRSSSFTVPSSVNRMASGSVIGYFHSYSNGDGQSEDLALTINGNVKTIDANAISGAVNLTLIPGVESIGTNAFSTLWSLYYKGTPRSFQAIQGISGSGINMSKVSFRDTNAEGISLNMNSATVNVGKYITLTKTVTPSNATDQSVTWSSSNTAVATVSSSGRVTGVSAGTATITATTNDGGFTASCYVTVNIGATGVALNKTNTVVRPGGTEQLTATVSPADASNRAVTWSSSNQRVATVADGLITAVAPGTATITATTVDGGYTASCNITVPVPVTAVSLNLEEANLNYYSYLQLAATITPEGATNKNVIWTSSDPSVATVDSNGRVRGEQNGNAVITAVTEDGGFTASCSVTVIVPVEGVHLTLMKATVREGDTFQLVGWVTPHYATNPAVVWTSSDETVAAVDQNGLVSGIMMGTATIQVTSLENPSYYSTCEITVEEAPLASGTEGGLTWEFYRSSGTLYLNGTGEMSSAPWTDYSSRIHAVEMSEGVTSICDEAFSGSQISEITIPGTVSRIGEEAFADCSQLGEIHFAGDMPEVEETSFEAVNATVFFPAGNTTFTYDIMQNYGGSLNWNRPMFTVSYSGNGGTEIETSATAYVGESVPVTRRMPTREGFFFAGWSRNANAAAPEYVFGDGIAAESDLTLYAVWEGPDLKLPASLTTIEADAFSGTAFTSAIIPDSVTRIEAGAFANNSKLARVYIPDTVTEIDPNAFQTGQNLVIYCEPGGVVESYAEAKNISTFRETPVYDVTYDANGGHFSNGMTVRAEEAETGEYAVSAVVPIRDAYQFAEWTLNGTPVGETLNITSDITLVASWTPESSTEVSTVTVTYDAGEGRFTNGDLTRTSSASAGEYLLEYGENDLVYEDHSFIGWFIDDELAEDVITVSHDIILTAGWEASQAYDIVPEGVTIWATSATSFDLDMSSEQTDYFTASSEVTGVIDTEGLDYVWESCLGDTGMEEEWMSGAANENDDPTEFRTPVNWGGMMMFRLVVNGVASEAIEVTVNVMMCEECEMPLGQHEDWCSQYACPECGGASGFHESWCSSYNSEGVSWVEIGNNQKNSFPGAVEILIHSWVGDGTGSSYTWYKSADQQEWSQVGDTPTYREILTAAGTWQYKLVVDGIESDPVSVTITDEDVAGGSTS